MTINVNKKVFNDAYFDFIHNKSDTLIFYGGSGSGKSYFVAQRIILEVLNGGVNYLVIRKVAATLKDSVFALLESVIYNWKLDKLFKINKTDKTIICRSNGYTILCKGLDNPEKIKSITVKKGIINRIWIEEATELVEKELNQLKLRMRGKTLIFPQIILTFNPINHLHWLKRRFFDDIDITSGKYISPYLSVLKTTYKDNKHLTKSDIRTIEDLINSDPVYYKIYALGEWGILGNIVFTNWEVKNINEEERIFSNFRYGIDWGINDPFVCLKFAINDNRKEIYIFDEVYQKGLDTNDKIIPIIKPFVNKGLVVCDNSELKSINDLKKAGINAIPCKKGKDSIHEGIKWLCGYKIFVSPKCQNTINELSIFKRREDRNGNVIDGEYVDKFNHAIDCIRYGSEDKIFSIDNKPILFGSGITRTSKTTFDKY